MIKKLEGKIVGVFNTDFGTKYGFGVEEYFRFRDLWKNGYINRLIFRDKSNKFFEFDYNLVYNAIPLGNILPKMLSGIEIFSKERIRTAFISKLIFDFFAKKKIPKISNGVLITYPDYLKTIQYAKKLGYIIILSVGAHPNWILKTAELEYKNNNIKLNTNYEARIFKKQEIALKYADYFITLSEFGKKTFIDNGIKTEKIFVNNLGSNKNAELNFKRENKPLQFLFVANITLMKGLQYLLEAWKNLKLPDAELIICGGCAPEFQKILDGFLKSEKSIKYVGHVTNPEKYYKIASVYVHPSLIEGMPRAVVEAMSYKLPIIATPISAPFITNGIEGFTVESRDIQAIEKAILFFYNNRNEIERMGNNAFNMAKNLTYENFSKKMMGILDEIVSMHNS